MVHFVLLGDKILGTNFSCSASLFDQHLKVSCDGHDVKMAIKPGISKSLLAWEYPEMQPLQ